MWLDLSEGLCTVELLGHSDRQDFFLNLLKQEEKKTKKKNHFLIFKNSIFVWLFAIFYAFDSKR